MTKKIAEIQEEENQALKRYLLSHRLILGIFLFCFCSSAHSCKYLLKKNVSFPYSVILLQELRYLADSTCNASLISWLFNTVIYFLWIRKRKNVLKEKRKQRDKMALNMVLKGNTLLVTDDMELFNIKKIKKKHVSNKLLINA